MGGQGLGVASSSVWPWGRVTGTKGCGQLSYAADDSWGPAAPGGVQEAGSTLSP